MKTFTLKPIKKYIPARIKKMWKIYRYNISLINTTLARNSDRSPVQWIKSLHKERKRILFFPDIPWESSVMYQMCLELGYRITNNPSGVFDVVVKWKDATTYEPDPILFDLEKSNCVININCLDISKVHVDEVFKKVFGYSATVDPRTFFGECVQKSNLNAKHDGRIISCPIREPDEGSIYQILIDNRIKEDCVMDMRVPIFQDTIPCVLLWFKPIRSRFTVDIDRRQMVEVSEVLSKEEQRNILRFCKMMGLDYGELDILNNKPDRRIYIIDVNPTPDGPPLELIKADERTRESIRRRSIAFANAFVETQYGLSASFSNN